MGDRADLKAKLEDLSKLHEEQEKRHKEALAVQVREADLALNWVRLAPNGTNPKLFQIRF